MLVLSGAVLLAMQKRWMIFSSSILWLVVTYIAILHPISLFSLKQLDEVDLFYLNAHYSNEHPEEIIEPLNDTSPKTIVLVESSPEVVNIADAIRDDQAINHRAYASSCTIYTINFLDAEVANLTHLPICIIRYEEYDLLSIHAHRPLGEANLKENVEFFDTIKNYIDDYESTNRSFILVGDFNSSNYSKLFRDRFGEYIQTNRYTWMTNTPITLPIDHVITNMNVEVAQQRIKGSDHSALLINFLDQ
jgi:hypothetical protein